jgi:hypothetical protein
MNSLNVQLIREASSISYRRVYINHSASCKLDTALKISPFTDVIKIKIKQDIVSCSLSAPVLFFKAAGEMLKLVHA